MQAQAYLAQSPEGQELELDRDARVKLVCVRSEIVAGYPTSAQVGKPTPPQAGDAV